MAPGEIQRHPAGHKLPEAGTIGCSVEGVELESQPGQGEEQPKEKLSLRTKLVFGVGESVQGIYAIIAGFYLNTYLLEVACLDPYYVALIQIIAGVFDAVNDPVIGMLSDRTRTRWGRRRPWLIFAAPFLAVSYFLLWYGVPVEAATPFKVIYYLACYMAVSIGMTCVTVQVGSLVPELTDDYDERSEVTAYRIMIGYAVGFGCAIVHQVILKKADGLREGYQLSGLIFALIMWAATWLFFLGIHERFIPEQESSQEIPLWDQITSVFQSWPFRCVVLVYLCGPTAVVIIQANILMYAKYILRNEDLASIMIPIVMGTCWLSIPIWQRVSIRFGKQGIYYLGVTFLIVGVVLMSFLNHKTMIAAYVVSFLVGAGLVVPYFVPISMLPDVIEDDELKTGKRREGIFFGFFTVAMKLSTTAALGITNFLLKASGYQAPRRSCGMLEPETVDLIERQPRAVLMTLRILISGVPTIFFIAGVALVYYYPLTKERQKELVANAAHRRELRRKGLPVGPVAEANEADYKVMSQALDELEVAASRTEQFRAAVNSKIAPGRTLQARKQGFESNCAPCTWGAPST